MPRMSIVRSRSTCSPEKPFRFAGPAGRRYGLDIAGIFVIKLPLLLLLWLVAIRPSTISPDTATRSVARMYSTSAPAKSQ